MPPGARCRWLLAAPQRFTGRWGLRGGRRASQPEESGGLREEVASSWALADTQGVAPRTRQSTCHVEAAVWAQAQRPGAPSGQRRGLGARPGCGEWELLRRRRPDHGCFLRGSGGTNHLHRGAGMLWKARVMAGVGTRAGVSHGRERQGGGSGNNLGERWWGSATRRRPHDGEKGQTGKIFGRWNFRIW